MSDILFKTKRPITLKAGTGVSLSANGKGFTQKDFDGTDDSIVRVSIGQVVQTSSNVQFNDVILSSDSLTVGTGSNVLVFSDGKIVGDVNFQNNVVATENIESVGNLTFTGTRTSSYFTSSISSVTQSVITGSNKFGSDINNDKQFFTGSMSITGSYNLNQYSENITEISNDTTAVDEKSTSLITEYATYQFLQNIKPERDYLRKSFVHTGSFVNSTTTRFSVVTASAPSNFTSTTENDFMFFVNGMLMENDALTIQQSSNNLDLTIDSDSLGYTFSSDDEIIGFGKFDS
tara:strand:+ start:2086 stop:2955 length:870 start_codon:yes stop_codon:yes gene_type:complete